MSARSSTPTEPVPAVRVEGLDKTFPGAVRALQGLTFSVPAGDLTALVGGNGSGKTTLLRVLFGILPPDRGDVEVLGVDPRRDGPALRARSGFAGQDAALDTETTGWETLRLFYALRGLPHKDRERRLAELAEDYGLTSFCDRRIKSYSGGQRRRLHLALSTMHAPCLLLLDEPTAGLDPQGRGTLWRRLVGWRADGRTVLVATHDLHDVATHCDRVLLLDGGRLLADERPADLIAEHGRARAVITLAEGSEMVRPVEQDLRDVPGVREVVVDDQTVTLWRDRHPHGGEPALELLADRGIAFSSYERQEPDLSSAYFHLTGTRWSTPAPHGGERHGGGQR